MGDEKKLLPTSSSASLPKSRALHDLDLVCITGLPRRLSSALLRTRCGLLSLVDAKVPQTSCGRSATITRILSRCGETSVEREPVPDEVQVHAVAVVEPHGLTAALVRRICASVRGMTVVSAERPTVGAATAETTVRNAGLGRTS